MKDAGRELLPPVRCRAAVSASDERCRPGIAAASEAKGSSQRQYGLWKAAVMKMTAALLVRSSPECEYTQDRIDFPPVKLPMRFITPRLFHWHSIIRNWHFRTLSPMFSNLNLW
jgi:hypothetical protein